jgi:hypothetical protein
MAEHAAPAKSETHLFHLVLLIGGGLCLATGILNLYYSFGWIGGDMNSNFAQIGFSGIDNISPLPMADFAIPMVAVGAAMMVFANAIAWRETDGY